jgi:hypothetical protein
MMGKVPWCLESSGQPWQVGNDDFKRPTVKKMGATRRAMKEKREKKEKWIMNRTTN